MTTIFILLAFVIRAVRGYPGEPWIAPRIHHSPECLHVGGWHDIAGALTKGTMHHVFQGCPAAGGWSHAVSSDFVHWEDLGVNVAAVEENYQGMDSKASPCSGFVAMDSDGTVCAGFRQCSSSKGTTGLNPEAHSWDVPLELRCAKDENLTQWLAPEFILPFYYYRALPYDPVRPWKDEDGLWYLAMSTDGCNSTTRRTPCAAGGQLDLYASPALRGPNADWKHVRALFTTNETVSGSVASPGAITAEFVTSNFFGGIPGDPDGGRTRVVTQNNAGPTFWVGRQAGPGDEFLPYWRSPGAVGHYDYGSLTMARTLGSDPNQVHVNGRKVLVGWIGGGAPASQSLARDLSLSNEHALLQQFVPELQMLRIRDTYATLSSGAAPETQVGSMQLEISADFTFDSSVKPSQPFGFSVLGSPDGEEATLIVVKCSKDPVSCTVGVDGSKQKGNVFFGPLLPSNTSSVHVHAIVDHSIIEVIVNNRTSIVAYTNPSAENHTSVALFGTGANSTAEATLHMWELASA